MKTYLIETFRYNHTANKQLLPKIDQLPDKKEAIRYFSHLINSQNKWLKRIQVFPADPKMDWWEPVYDLEQLENLWIESVTAWIDLIHSKTEDELNQEVKFIGFDGTVFAAALKDIALQLNYHSIHHRAQIQTIIRSQGLEPDFIDYIATKYRRVEE